MFLDSVNIISDHTFYAQSQDYGGKVPWIFGRNSLPSPDDGREIEILPESEAWSET